MLIITEQGSCDRGYRYNVSVSKGYVSYQGEATIAPNGLVKVNIKFGDKGADGGTGRLSGSSGTGASRGVGSNGGCAGRWEAERR